MILVVFLPTRRRFFPVPDLVIDLRFSRFGVRGVAVSLISGLESRKRSGGLDFGVTMPFPTKIQPIDVRGLVRSDQAKPVPKSRLKRLFERQFPGVLRISSVERLDLEPSSVCLDKMVRSFMEDNNGEKPSSRCGHSRCNCFHGHCDDSSDDDLDFISSSNSGDAPIVSAAEVIKVPADSLKIHSPFGGSYPLDIYDSRLVEFPHFYLKIMGLLQGLVVCTTVSERNLLADASTVVERNKNFKRKNEHMKAVTDGLRSLGYDASLCKSRWEKTASIPAGTFLLRLSSISRRSLVSISDDRRPEGC